jgi:hypothetical protein
MLLDGILTLQVILTSSGHRDSGATDDDDTVLQEVERELLVHMVM